MSLNVARKLWALDTPTFTFDSSLLMFGASGSITVPMPAFLIEHEKGLILFDTGLSPSGMADPVAEYGEEVAAILGLQATPEQQIDRQLANLGFRTEQITHVVSSHLHLDHAGAHHLFPQATFYVGAGEFANAFAPDPVGAFAYAPEALGGLRQLNWRIVPGADVDLFGDGSLTILSMPGHTQGNLSLKVRLASRTFILAGDTAHLRAALAAEFPTPFDDNSKIALQSLRRLKRIQEAEEATVWITHDPQDWAELGNTGSHFE